jgi:hypothetical protein
VVGVINPFAGTRVDRVSSHNGSPSRRANRIQNWLLEHVQAVIEDVGGEWLPVHPNLNPMPLGFGHDLNARRLGRDVR